MRSKSTQRGEERRGISNWINSSFLFIQGGRGENFGYSWEYQISHSRMGPTKGENAYLQGSKTNVLFDIAYGKHKSSF